MAKIPEKYLPPKDTWPEYLVPEEFADTPMEVNLADFLIDRHVREGRGDNPAIKFMDKTITYAQLQQQVNKFGNALKAVGVEAQDRVGIRLVNRPGHRGHFCHREDRRHPRAHFTPVVRRGSGVRGQRRRNEVLRGQCPAHGRRDEGQTRVQARHQGHRDRRQCRPSQGCRQLGVSKRCWKRALPISTLPC